MDSHANIKTYFRAPWSTSLTVSTIFFVGLLGAGVIFTDGWPSALIAAILLAGLLFSVTGYSLKNDRLYIHRLGWRIPWNLTGSPAWRSVPTPPRAPSESLALEECSPRWATSTILCSVATVPT